MTSSPGSSSAWQRMNSAWMPPVVTMTSSVAADRNAVLAPQLLGQQLEQPRHAGRLQVVAAVLVDRALHRRLDGVGRVEADVALIEAERILDAVHHVADADDAGERNAVEKLAHVGDSQPDVAGTDSSARRSTRSSVDAALPTAGC